MVTVSHQHWLLMPVNEPRIVCDESLSVLGRKMSNQNRIENSFTVKREEKPPITSWYG